PAPGGGGPGAAGDGGGLAYGHASDCQDPLRLAALGTSPRGALCAIRRMFGIALCACRVHDVLLPRRYIMERELWRLIRESLRRLPRRRLRNAVYTDDEVLAVLLWAALHQRPVSWGAKRS